MTSQVAPIDGARDRAPVVAEWMRRLVWFWDEAIEIPVLGWKVGFDALIGLVPGFGDLAGLLVGSLIVVAAARLGAGGAVVGRMVLNLGIDALVGAVPLLGDIFDVGWKANRRNVDLLERWVASPGPVARSSGLVLGLVAGTLAAMGTALVWMVVAGLKVLLG